jgi:hypothetical protein
MLQNVSIDTIFYIIMSTNLNNQCPNCNHWFTKQKLFRHHIRACRRAIKPETSPGIATSSCNPLLSIANKSSGKPSSTFSMDLDYASSDIDPRNDVFDNADNSLEDADVPNPSYPSFQPSKKKESQ